MKVVLDTDVLIADTDVLIAAIRSRRGASRACLRAALSGEANLLLPVPLALEYEAVLTRPEHLTVSGASIGRMLALLDALCAVCDPVENPFLWRPMLRDPD